MSLPPAEGVTKGEGVVVSEGVVSVDKVEVKPTEPAPLDSAIVGTGVVLGTP